MYSKQDGLLQFLPDPTEVLPITYSGCLLAGKVAVASHLVWLLTVAVGLTLRSLTLSSSVREPDGPQRGCSQLYIFRMPPSLTEELVNWFQDETF